MKFALITEGPSEHRVVKHIIAKMLKDSDPEINQIQPKLIDGRQDQSTPGGWNEVLKYCGREEIRDILIENDYLVIQIDTDLSEQPSFGVSHRNNLGKEKEVEDLYSDVCSRLKSLIQAPVLADFEERILFAICIHSIECWLLPIYFTDNKKSKTKQCPDTLNSGLARNNIHKITSSNKNEPNGVAAYTTILKSWKKASDIKDAARYNDGFRLFVESLEVTNP